MRPTLILILLAASACGASEPDAPATATWSTLVTSHWSLEPGGEKTKELSIASIDHDMYIGGIRPISPPGTHHSLLYRGQDVASANIIYASGVGTNEVVFPAGTGLKLEAGSLIGLQLHVFNSSDEMISGESGIEVLEADPASITDEADIVLAGPHELEIPPGQTSSQTGTCTVSTHQSVFALFPHMHQLGSHFKTTLTRGGAPSVIHDASYSFNEQAFLTFEPTTLEPGDTITTECTWDNTTADAVHYGESSTAEMCYSIMLRYPSSSSDNAFCDQ